MMIRFQSILLENYSLIACIILQYTLYNGEDNFATMNILKKRER